MASEGKLPKNQALLTIYGYLHNINDQIKKDKNSNINNNNNKLNHTK